LDRFRFLAWTWAMLLVIAVSAAPDGAAPGSRPIGSAFDPATSAVAIGRKHARMAVMTQVEAPRPPLPHAAAGGVAAAILPALAFPDMGASPSLRAADLLVVNDPRSRTRAHGARAPPIV
jgi:hypothetical protein